MKTIQERQATYEEKVRWLKERIQHCKDQMNLCNQIGNFGGADAARIACRRWACILAAC
jgi:hypothetical protein